MYDELIKRLRDYEESGLAPISPYEAGKAADAIEELSKRVPPAPHGRLIDADALTDIFRGFIAMYDSCPFNQLSLSDKSRCDELQAALAEVIDAPTIIPAEEGET